MVYTVCTPAGGLLSSRPLGSSGETLALLTRVVGDEGHITLAEGEEHYGLCDSCRLSQGDLGSAGMLPGPGARGIHGRPQLDDEPGALPALKTGRVVQHYMSAPPADTCTASKILFSISGRPNTPL